MTAEIEPTEDLRHQAEVIAMTVRNALEEHHDLISDEAMAVINRTVRDGAVTALHALYDDHPRPVDWVAFQRWVTPPTGSARNCFPTTSSTCKPTTVSRDYDLTAVLPGPAEGPRKLTGPEI